MSTRTTSGRRSHPIGLLGDPVPEEVDATCSIGTTILDTSQSFRSYLLEIEG